jgi:hypothetical protein
MYTWLIPDGYVPKGGNEVSSHEAICILNTNKKAAKINVDIYFVDQEPIRNVIFTIQGKRSARIILSKSYQLDIHGVYKLDVPEEVPFSLRLRSKYRLAIQYTRLDTRYPSMALMSIFVPQVKG